MNMSRAAASAIVAALMAATSCGSDTTNTSPRVELPAEVVDVSHETTDTTLLDTTLLIEFDSDGLAFMREEEKLAGDVYQAMFEAWGLPIFDNIAAAEQTHTMAIVELLDQYDVPDPARDLGQGEFSNPDLQALYDELIERGSQSATEALEVGALIEELDITDLRLRASEEPDIDMVYANLERGSRNHLRAFNRQLERRGDTYAPVYLDQEVFDEIVTNGSRGFSA